MTVKYRSLNDLLRCLAVRSRLLAIVPCRAPFWLCIYVANGPLHRIIALRQRLLNGYCHVLAELSGGQQLHGRQKACARKDQGDGQGHSKWLGLQVCARSSASLGMHTWHSQGEVRCTKERHSIRHVQPPVVKCITWKSWTGSWMLYTNPSSGQEA